MAGTPHNCPPYVSVPPAPVVVVGGGHVTVPVGPRLAPAGVHILTADAPHSPVRVGARGVGGMFVVSPARGILGIGLLRVDSWSPAVRSRGGQASALGIAGDRAKGPFRGDRAGDSDPGAGGVPGRGGGRLIGILGAGTRAQQDCGDGREKDTDGCSHLHLRIIFYIPCPSPSMTGRAPSPLVIARMFISPSRRYSMESIE